MTRTATTGIFRGFFSLLGLSRPADGQADSSHGGDDINSSAHWKKFSKTWQEAEDIAVGRLGDFPFNRKGKARMLDAIAMCATHIDALESDTTINAAEAAMLRKDTDRLARAVEEKRTIEQADEPKTRTTIKVPAMASMIMLRERLGLLGQLAQANRLHSDVIEMILIPIERDMKTLNNSTMLSQLAVSLRGEATELRQQGREHIEQIKLRMSA